MKQKLRITSVLCLILIVSGYVAYAVFVQLSNPAWTPIEVFQQTWQWLIPAVIAGVLVALLNYTVDNLE